MQSKATSVAQYIRELPEDRRKAISAVRKVILENLPKGYREAMNWGMITYEVPLVRYADTYNGQPLAYAALASQKNHMAVYLMCVYMSEERRERFEAAYERSGKRLDVGKSCVRFRKLDDLPLELVGQMIREVSVDEYVEVAGEGHPSKKKKAVRTRTKKKAK